jgi:3-mercaptopyruvate sulfurtransferase SseA
MEGRPPAARLPEEGLSMKWTSLRPPVAALLVMAGSLPAIAADDVATVPRISLADFKKQHEQDKVLVIDTRSAESYRAGHIPGAISTPLSAWNEHLPRLKASRKPIVAYCA